MNTDYMTEYKMYHIHEHSAFVIVEGYKYVSKLSRNSTRLDSGAADVSTCFATRSSAVAERSRDASCVSVVSLNSATPPAQSIISYIGFRFTNAYN